MRVMSPFGRALLSTCTLFYREKPTVAPRRSKMSSGFSSQSSGEDYVSLDMRTDPVRKCSTQSLPHGVQDSSIQHPDFTLNNSVGGYFTLGSHGRHPTQQPAIRPLDTDHFKGLHSSAVDVGNNGHQEQKQPWVRERGGSIDSQGSSSSREGFLSPPTLVCPLLGQYGHPHTTSPLTHGMSAHCPLTDQNGHSYTTSALPH